MACAGVLLAAGAAHRFGAHKLLAALPDGEPVGLRAARNLVAVLPDTVAVVRPGDRVLADLLAGAGLEVVVNPQAADGIGGSIAAGVAARAAAGGWIVALADMPWIRPDTIRAVVRALEAGASLAAPVYRGDPLAGPAGERVGGERGHPVGFAARWGAELMAMTGDRGARLFLAGAASDLVLVPTRDRGVLEDVDVPSDLPRPRATE